MLKISLLKSLLAEITACTGVFLITIGLLFFTTWEIALIFFGGFLMIAGAYISNTMNMEEFINEK